jgi:hypothetical protein
MSRDIRDVIRDEPLMRDRLLALLAGGPLTVSELAAAAERPAEEVMVWMMGLRRYGHVVEEKATARATEYRYAVVRQP